MFSRINFQLSIDSQGIDDNLAEKERKLNSTTTPGASHLNKKPFSELTFQFCKRHEHKKPLRSNHVKQRQQLF